MSFLGGLVSEIKNNVLPQISLKGVLQDVVSDTLRNINIEAASPPKEVSGDYQPGNVNIHEIVIVSADGQKSMDLKSQVTEMHFYESLVSPAIYGEMYIADAIGLADTFPIDTNAFVRVAFQTPNAPGPETTYFFHINRVSNKVPSNVNNKMMTYTIQLISSEVISVMNQPIIGKQYNDTPGKIIENILKDDIKTKKPIHIDGSKGIQKGVIPRRFPFAAIHEFVLLSDVTPHGHAVHTFYENKNGYNFTTFEKLISDGRKLIDQDLSDKRFYYDAARNEGVDTVKQRNILAYNQSVFCDAGEFYSLGSVSEAVGFNNITGQLTQVARNTGTEKGNLTEETGVPIRTADFVSRSGPKATVRNIIPVNPDVNQGRLEEVLVKRRAMLLKIMQVDSQIYVYGDTALTVGDVIECTFPLATVADNTDGVSPTESGKYLITHLRHIVLNTDRPQHAIACNLMKIDHLGI